MCIVVPGGGIPMAAGGGEPRLASNAAQSLLAVGANFWDAGTDVAGGGSERSSRLGGGAEGFGAEAVAVEAAVASVAARASFSPSKENPGCSSPATGSSIQDRTLVGELPEFAALIFA